jgi:hypothetical protein
MSTHIPNFEDEVISLSKNFVENYRSFAKNLN